MKTPKVTIQVRSFGARKVYVSGEVPRPGTINLTGPLSVLSAVNDAGGISIKGNRNRVVLIRRMPDGGPGRKEIVLFVKGQPTRDAMTMLQPFDVVLVPESKIARVDRWVDQFVKQLSPANLFVGFNYMWQPASQVLPF